MACSLLCNYFFNVSYEIENKSCLLVLLKKFLWYSYILVRFFLLGRGIPAANHSYVDLKEDSIKEMVTPCSNAVLHVHVCMS